MTYVFEVIILKAVILAGGLGTRITEESHLKPKPMVDIGEYPILWHIMKNLYHQGIKEFVICAGYKQHIIKEYFDDYFLHKSDVTFDFADSKKTIVHNTAVEQWKVTIVDTGLNTMTGGRLKRIEKYLDDDDFLMTYGDGLSDLSCDKLIEFHKKHGKIATITAVHPIGRFGILELEDSKITNFGEKTESVTGWINGGFMILKPSVLDYIQDDSTVFEKEPLERLSSEGELMGYKHDGFWHCMDTVRDKQILEDIWNTGKAPWKNW